MSEIVETIEAIQIVAEAIQEDKSQLKDLESAFNSIKRGDIDDHSKLTDKFTLKGMKEFSTLVTTTVLKIEEFANRGKEQSTTSSFGSKMLAVIDKNNSHVGKWIKGKQKDFKIESLEQKNITELLQSLRTTIEQKREEVVEKIVELKQIRDGVISRIKDYEILGKKVSHIALTAEEYTREKLDAEQLATMVNAAIFKSTNNLKSFIEPLLTSATISAQKIQSILPSIEDDLQSKLAYKSFQEDLQSLHEITKATQDLSKEVGTVINDSIKNTIYESISFLKNTGIDIKEYEDLAKKEFAHQNKINSLLTDAASSITKDFNYMQGVHSNLLEQTKKSNPMLTQYSEG